MRPPYRPTRDPPLSMPEIRRMKGYIGGGKDRVALLWSSLIFWRDRARIAERTLPVFPGHNVNRRPWAGLRIQRQRAEAFWAKANLLAALLEEIGVDVGGILEEVRE